MALNRTILLSGLALCLGLMTPLQAAPLTPAQVGQFINALPDIEVLGDNHQAPENRPVKIDPNKPLTSSLENMTPEDAAYKDLEVLAKKHGFSSAEDLADVGDRVTGAYQVVNVTSLKDLEASYEESFERIRNDPDLSEATRAGVLKGMERTTKRYLALVKETEEDMPAVREHKEALDKIFR